MDDARRDLGLALGEALGVMLGVAVPLSDADDVAIGTPLEDADGDAMYDKLGPVDDDTLRQTASRCRQTKVRSHLWRLARNIARQSTRAYVGRR